MTSRAAVTIVVMFLIGVLLALAVYMIHHVKPSIP